MPDQTRETKAAGPAATTPAYEWEVHPVRRRPWVSVAVSLLIVLIIAVVRIATDSQVFAVLAAIILLASLAKFYFPTRYQLDELGVTVKTMTQTLKKEWSLYRSCYPDKNGILLSPFAGPSRLENFRGLYVMFDKNRDEVTAYCRAHIGKPSTAVTNAAGSAGESS